ncbi:MAG: hypothetical protein WD118_01940 [Phycisphaeraceae bacterium]
MSTRATTANQRIGRALVLLAIVLGVLVLSSGISLGPGGPSVAMHAAWLVPVVALTWLIFWLVQFVDLMASRDSRFAGRHDKLIWAAVFVFVFPLAPFAFWLWKQAVIDRDAAETERP